jgi:hypothetical protein
MKNCSVLFLSILFLINKSYTQSTLYGIKNTAQTYELVGIDCSHDSVTVITPQFPSVVNNFPLYYYTPNFSSCYNYKNKIYYLCTGQILYVVDVLTGAITDTFDFRTIHPNFLLHIVYNPKDGFIYGVLWDLATSAEKFARFDPATGIFLDTIPIPQPVGVGIGCKSVIDAGKQEYIVQSTGLAAIDISTGNVIYNNPIQNITGQTLDHIAYSCKYQKIFGLSNNPDVPEEYFSSVDSVTALVNNIDISPLPVNYYKQYQSGCSIDNITDICYYAASGGIIYGINIYSGNVVYNHNYGPGFDFLFIESASDYDCEIETIKHVDENNGLILFPNPVRNSLYLTKSNEELIKNISIFNTIGCKQTIEYSSIKNNEDIELNLSSLSSGIYFLELFTDKRKVVRRFVKD